MNVSFFNSNMSKYMPKFYLRYSELQHDPSLSLPSAIQYQPGDREREREVTFTSYFSASNEIL